jgi:hypothetical protein
VTGGEGRVGLDAKTDGLNDYALQNNLDFSKFARLTYTENEENHFDHRL